MSFSEFIQYDNVQFPESLHNLDSVEEEVHEQQAVGNVYAMENDHSYESLAPPKCESEIENRQNESSKNYLIFFSSLS